MRDRMNVPQGYEPILLVKVKAYIEKKKTAAETEGQTIWYQCVDRVDYFAKDGHKSCTQDGVSILGDVLNNPDNEGALMVTYEDNRLFTIRDGTMVSPHLDYKVGHASGIKTDAVYVEAAVSAIADIEAIGKKLEKLTDDFNIRVAYNKLVDVCQTLQFTVRESEDRN